MLKRIALYCALSKNNLYVSHCNKKPPCVNLRTYFKYIANILTCTTGIGAQYSAYTHIRDAHIQTAPLYHMNKHSV